MPLFSFQHLNLLDYDNIQKQNTSLYSLKEEE